MVRGINRQDIFHDTDDYQKYLDTLSRVKEENHFQVLGYCLMTNHYVVRDNVTGKLVQTSKFGDVNWRPDSSIINPYKP
ncbi:MAG: hypothetical protein PHU36_03180 [Syntrophomonadaceae bacterium]|nr:hypothetical protein [Syntrophomonadaceae bacterium]